MTVPARLLTDFVASLPNDKIDLTVGERGKQLHISCARNEATMAGMDAADFPPVPQVERWPLPEARPEDPAPAIAQVQFAAAADDTRPVLTGIHIARRRQRI